LSTVLHLIFEFQECRASNVITNLQNKTRLKLLHLTLASLLLPKHFEHKLNGLTPEDYVLNPSPREIANNESINASFYAIRNALGLNKTSIEMVHFLETLGLKPHFYVRDDPRLYTNIILKKKNVNHMMSRMYATG